MKTKTIYDYFSDEIEYPTVCSGEILPFGTVYSNTMTTFLDGFINSCEKHLICYTLDWFSDDIKGKRALVDRINSGKLIYRYTKISDMDDDIFIISKIEEGYMLFWYHGGGRCDIGRFKTDDTVEQIEQSVINWLEEMKEYNITGYDKIDPTKYFGGWVSY